MLDLDALVQGASLFMTGTSVSTVRARSRVECRTGGETMTACEECGAASKDTYFQNMIGSGGLRCWLCDGCFIKELQ